MEAGRTGNNSGPRVLVAGGGIAGLEAVLALRELSEGALDITLVSAEPELTYRPLLVTEPFGSEPASRFSLAPAMDDLGCGFRLGSLRSIDPVAGAAVLEDGARLGFDYAVICTGARLAAAYRAAHTLWTGAAPDSIDAILDELAGGKDGTLSFVIPGGVSWPLPLYEVALLTANRLRERAQVVPLQLLSPEDAPLSMFGNEASAGIATLLEAHGIDFHGSAWVREEDDGTFRATGAEQIELGRHVVALPLIVGAPIDGLPSNEEGFIPTDEHSRVEGIAAVYAAGDGTAFPIKQGGIATQQADAAAEHICSRIGVVDDPAPFRPVLRGKLLTGGESMYMRAAVSGGAGEPTVSPDYLWWPPHKVGGRYLAAWLAGGAQHADLEPPEYGIDVEVALPAEWHGEPMAPAPYRAPESD